MSTDSEEHLPSREDNLIKVSVHLEPADWHRHAIETMWARVVGGGRFQLRNVPFYAYAMSYDDIVDAEAEGDRYFVRKVIEHGGHSTYRIFVTNTIAIERFDEFWAPLERLGCTLERATERLFAIDVPPHADIYTVYELLQAGEDASVWDFEEAHVGHRLRVRSDTK